MEEALVGLLRPDEKVHIKLRGAFKEGLICTDARAIVLKGGFMTGQLVGTGSFQVPYGNVAGVEVKFHLLTGYFELSAGGMQSAPKNYWSRQKGTDPAKAPNCISLNTRDQAERFRQACAFITERCQAARSPSEPSESRLSERGSEETILSSIERLGELRSKGLLSEEEFQKKKRELLSKL